jgi:hypothetical protein
MDLPSNEGDVPHHEVTKGAKEKTLSANRFPGAIRLRPPEVFFVSFVPSW